jgi:hypothetical protein
VKLEKTSLRDQISLNVGGERYATTISTLTREPGTYFTDIFNGKWEDLLDDIDRSLFIDRNGEIFAHVLKYLRTDTVADDVLGDDIIRHRLLIEAKYFEMSRLTDILTKAEKQITADKIEQTFLNGTLLQLEQKKKLNEFYGNSNQQWILIYKASSHGFDANAFHNYCNNQGPTMTIIQSNNNYIFGGYTAIGWTSDGSYKNDPTAFLFTLTNPHNITPTKYPVNPAHAS